MEVTNDRDKKFFYSLTEKEILKKNLLFSAFQLNKSPSL